ncbi:MAG: sugar ABC transporter substrate-binding protein [Dorea sp.]|nr:sugar ABC transporter substrate-binding protein [Dorea sp.]MCI9613881.1 sugar ABC transporter substrate-binding protein [Dorea sp.]
MKSRTIMKKVVSTAIVSIMTLSLAACGGSPSSEGGEAKSEDDGKSVTLEFQQWWGPEMPEGTLKEICDDFTKESGIGIELLSNPYADTKTQVAAGAAAGTMADVVGLDGSWVYDFAKQGSIANLTELMEDDGYDDSQLSAQIQFEGNTYMIPVVNFAYPMYANMDILKAAGVTELPATREDFVKACEAIKAYDSSIAGFAIPLSTESPNGIQNQVMTWLWASGDSMLESGKPNLSGNKELEEVVDFVKELFDKDLIAAGSYSMVESDMVEEFTNGRVAFMIDGVSHLTMIKDGNPELDFAYTTVPVKSGYSGTVGMEAANWGIGIAENCEHKKEALQFVEYLLSPEVNAKMAALANAFPGNTKAEPDYSKSDELFVEAYELYQQCETINEFTGLPTSEDLMRSFEEQLQLYLDGDTASVSEMLEETQKLWEPAFE